MSSSDSDSGDEDYVPSDGGSQPPSEVESDGDEEDSDVNDDEEAKNSSSKGKKKKRRSEGDGIPEESKEDKEDIKQKSESLWSDFLKDVSQDGGEKDESSSDNVIAKKEKKIVTEVYEFAGEKVSISKEVDDSIPSKIRKVSSVLNESSGSDNKSVTCENEEDKIVKKSEEKLQINNMTENETKKSVLGLSHKSHAIAKPNPKVGGSRSFLSSALDKLGKKNKLSTLEKSKLDWENYKNKEGISEEITAHNKGKAGYLDKRDFLEKTDLKQYELEKQLRNNQRSKR